MTQHREHWGSKIGFILAAIGSAIGLGVLWKFPYTVGQNGGGVFLFIYFVCLILIGIPVFIAELALGRKAQRASIETFGKLNPKKPGWKAAGVLAMISSFLIMSFYSVIAGWGMSYVVMSLNGFYQNLSCHEVGTVFERLSHSGGISCFWHFLFTLLTMGIVLSGVRKGIEFWSKIITRLLFALLVGLFLYSLTLDGFSDAVSFIFKPNFAQFKFSSALEALGLAFFTLSLGQGVMISYGSYMKKEDNIPQMALIVSSSVIVVSILAALTIFPIIFTFDLSPREGAGLVFKTLPYLFAQLPGALVLSTLFFTLFVFTAITSAVPFIEVVATNLMETKGWPRKKAVLLTACATFVFGVPSAFAMSGLIFPHWEEVYGMNFLNTVENLVFVWIVPICGLCTSIYVGWILDRKIMKEELGSHLKKLYLPWLFFMRWVVPAFILLIVVQKSGLFDFDRFFR